MEVKDLTAGQHPYSQLAKTYKHFFKETLPYALGIAAGMSIFPTPYQEAAEEAEKHETRRQQELEPNN